LDPSSARGLLKNCGTRDLKFGDVLIRAGVPNQSLYLVLVGRLCVYLNLDQDFIAELRTGEVAGEISLISGEPTSAFVVADEDS
jgi:CRP-like cAMP-binding protein